MKTLIKISVILFFGIIVITICKKNNCANNAFFGQEVYIVSSESASPAERTIANILAYTFVDTLIIVNDSYDIDTIFDYRTGNAQVKFKIGVGDSLAAGEDIHVTLAFDRKLIDDYNIEKNTDLFIPDPSLFTGNVPCDGRSGTFTVVIKKGESATDLIFNIPIHRGMENEYARYAFPVKIISCQQAVLSRLYADFLIAGLTVGLKREINRSGFPVPKLPEGRYHSTCLQGNVPENVSSDGLLRPHKFITRLDDIPGVETRYMIWGHGLCSFEVNGLHKFGWMYNILWLNDEVAGAYTMEPVQIGTKFSVPTFSYNTVQAVSENNSYDPKTKTLTLYYIDVDGQTCMDILTFLNNDFTIKQGDHDSSPENWNQVRSRGYNFWLPISEK